MPMTTPGRPQPSALPLPAEPKFVARPGAITEDDGWLLTVMFDSDTQQSQLVILDARDLHKGPVALLQFAHVVPSSLHGCWSSTYYGPVASTSGDAASDVAAAPVGAAA